MNLAARQKVTITLRIKYFEAGTEAMACVWKSVTVVIAGISRQLAWTKDGISMCRMHEKQRSRVNLMKSQRQGYLKLMDKQQSDSNITFNHPFKDLIWYFPS